MWVNFSILLFLNVFFFLESVFCTVPSTFCFTKPLLHTIYLSLCFFSCECVVRTIYSVSPVSLRAATRRATILCSESDSSRFFCLSSTSNSGSCIIQQRLIFIFVLAILDQFKKAHFQFWQLKAH